MESAIARTFPTFRPEQPLHPAPSPGVPQPQKPRPLPRSEEGREQDRTAAVEGRSTAERGEWERDRREDCWGNMDPTSLEPNHGKRTRKRKRSKRLMEVEEDVEKSSSCWPGDPPPPSSHFFRFPLLYSFVRFHERFLAYFFPAIGSGCRWNELGGDGKGVGHVEKRSRRTVDWHVAWPATARRKLDLTAA